MRQVASVIFLRVAVRIMMLRVRDGRRWRRNQKERVAVREVTQNKSWSFHFQLILSGVGLSHAGIETFGKKQVVMNVTISMLLLSQMPKANWKSYT